MLRFSQASVLASLLVTSSNGATTNNDQRRPQHCFLTCTSESSEAATEVTDTSSNLLGAGRPSSHVQNSIESRGFYILYFILYFHVLFITYYYFFTGATAASRLYMKMKKWCNNDYLIVNDCRIRYII